MRNTNIMRICALTLLALVPAVMPVAAHAVLLESTPAKDAVVHGPALSVRLRFNSRIDAPRSRLALVRPDGSSETLKIPEQATQDTLSGEATGLKPGSYKIRWQVLAADGHITRGEIPFTVAGN